MKTLKTLRLAGISLLLAVALAACDQAPGPAESAGKKIDQTADAAGRKLAVVADKAGEKLNERGEKLGVALDDAEITAKIKAAIFAEPGLKTLQINVDTVNGVVTLTGSADSLPDSDRAKALAGAVAGVKEVRNLLVLK